jgi:hypothetical protein
MASNDSDNMGSAPAAATPQHEGLSVAQQVLALLFVGVGVWYLAWRPESFNPAAPVFSRVIYGAEIFVRVRAAVPDDVLAPDAAHAAAGA